MKTARASRSFLVRPPQDRTSTSSSRLIPVCFQIVVRNFFVQCGNFASVIPAFRKAWVVTHALEKPCWAAAIGCACIGGGVRASLQRVPDFSDNHWLLRRSVRQCATSTPVSMCPRSRFRASARTRDNVQGMMCVRITRALYTLPPRFAGALPGIHTG